MSNPSSSPESTSITKSSGARTARGKPGPKPPTFKVFMVGISGAGKSIYLSSMFHSLNFQDNGRSYFLETTPEMRIALSKIYGTLVDTRKLWPRSTMIAEAKEYLFNCVAFDEANVKHHVLTINYLDYSGGLLVEEQEPGSNALRNLTEHINSADALLCLIDGYRVLQLLRGEAEGYNYFQVSIRTMIGLIQETGRPTHLLISKWDIVRNFGESADVDEQDRLKHVIDELMKFDHIRALLQLRDNRKIIRIIPVSAVGRSFVERIDTTGAMVKRHDAQLKPINIEVPLCAVIPDLFSHINSALSDNARKMLDAELRMRARLGPGKIASGIAAFLKRPAAVVVRTALFLALGEDVGKETASMFFAWAAQPYEKSMLKNAENRRAAELELKRFENTRERVLKDFTDAVLKLEALLPNSRLGRN